MDNDQSRKRKRTSSGGCALTSTHITENLHRYGETILHCTVNIAHGIKELGNTIVLKYVCALLNSGGGILHMRNIDTERGVVLSKHLDTWWSGMEIKMAEILSRDDICNYFDLVGDHDDHHLYLFVKTAEHLCSLQYYCRLPTDTATHEVTYQSMLRLLVNHGEPGSLSELPPIPDTFIHGRSAEALKKETKQIQFKQLSVPQKKSNSTLPEKIRGMMIKYVSAFANHEGGHIYFGIDDARASLIGEELSLSDQKKTEFLVGQRLDSMIWKDCSIRPLKGVHWDINFFPIHNQPRKGCRVVVVISVCKFPGGVFTNCPISAYVTSTKGNVAEFTFDQWKEALLNPLRDVPELHSRFLKVTLNVPRAPLVFTLPNTIDTIIHKVLLGKPYEVQPRRYIESYVSPSHRDHVHHVINQFKGGHSICLGMECWGLKVPMSQSDEIICDVAIVTEADGIHVITFSTSSSSHVQNHSQTAAKLLKTRLVQNGGCTEKFSVVCHIVDVSLPQVESIESFQRELAKRDIYPSHFCPSPRKFNKLLNSFAIYMASYKAKSHNTAAINQNGSYHFLLTHDQFELLWTQQFTRELWVHGPAGAGKTVAAVQLIQELRRRGCSHDNILYLAENDKLCEFVRAHGLCLVTSRRALLIDVHNTDLMKHKYGAICNVIVDECQNFKDRDGDWFSLAEKIANQKPENSLHHCCNYFWLFMDYSQKVHKFKAGLPTVIGKNNFMLSEVSRSTKEIFDFTSRLMMASENVDGLCSPLLPQVHSTPILAHNFSSGRGVDILSCKETEMKTLLSKVMSGLLKNGVQESDIAILVGRKTQLDQLQSTLQDIHMSEPDIPPTEVPGQEQADGDLRTNRSVEEHLKEVDSYTGMGTNVSNTNLDIDNKADEMMDSSEEDDLELSNPFDVLSSSQSLHSLDTVSDDFDSYHGNSLESRNKPENDVESVESDMSGKPLADTDLSDHNEKMDCHGDSSRGQKVKFYTQESVQESGDELATMSTTGDVFAAGIDNSKDVDEVERGVDLDTVKRFSGLDKAAIIGINPCVNDKHADFNKFILSLATRARDNLVIITTSENVKDQLEQFVNSPK